MTKDVLTARTFWTSSTRLCVCVCVRVCVSVCVCVCVCVCLFVFVWLRNVHEMAARRCLQRISASRMVRAEQARHEALKKTKGVVLRRVLGLGVGCV